MKLLNCLIALSLPILGMAQEEGALFIGFNASADYGYRILTNPDGNPSLAQLISNRNESEIPKGGYSAGIAARYILKESLWLEGGVSYTQRGYQTSYYPIEFIVPEPSAPEQLKLKYCYNYVDVPVRVVWPFGEDKFRPYIAGGLSGSFLLSAVSESIALYGDGRKEKNARELPKGMHAPLVLSATFGGGLNYFIGENSFFKGEVLFYQNLTNAYDGGGINAYLNGVGLSFGYYYCTF